jgi:hypothetical protein
MTALSVGILPLCPHVQQIRPQILFCDPPSIVCTECLTGRRAIIETLGHLWDHQCDRCGCHVQQLTPATTGGLGHITIFGHVCGCAADDQRQADADLVGRTGNHRARRGRR